MVRNNSIVVAALCDMIRKWSEVLRYAMMWHGCTDNVCIGDV